MGGAMNARSMLLQARLQAARIDPVLALAVTLVVVCAVAMLLLLQASSRLEREYDEAQRSARTPVASAAVPAPSVDIRLARFRDTLGAQESVQQQLAQVFALASQHGLVLRQGEYRRTTRPAARVVAYQINLPVKGSHEAVWQFALDVLRALPHAALDEVVFRREAIADPSVEARLRMTLYLDDGSRRTP